MSWEAVDDPVLGQCRRAPSGARLIEPLDAAHLSALLAGQRTPLRRTVGPPLAAATDCDEIWLDLSPFAGVGPVAPQSQTVRVGAAASWGAVEAHLSSVGLTLGPLPAELRVEPLYITLDRGARRRPSPRYGELLDAVLAARAVLPGGGLTRSAVAPRRATGPDLARSLIGAEGRAGLLVEVHLQAWPAPSCRGWRAVRLPDWPAALAAGVAALRAGARPAWWRLAASDGPAGVELLAGFAGADALEHALARFDEAVGGHLGDPALAEALEATGFEAGGAFGRAPSWTGPLGALPEALTGLPDAEIWDLRPEGASAWAAAPAPAAPDAWRALADRAFAQLEAR